EPTEPVAAPPTAEPERHGERRDQEDRAAQGGEHEPLRMDALHVLAPDDGPDAAEHHRRLPSRAGESPPCGGPPRSGIAGAAPTTAPTPAPGPAPTCRTKISCRRGSTSSKRRISAPAARARRRTA